MANIIRFGINGFGRIGRNIFRQMLDRDDFEVSIINDLSKPEQIAHLLKYDSVHGTLKHDVKIDGSTLVVGKHKVKLCAEKDPSKLPWKDTETPMVHECTGIFTDKEKASMHLQAGARRVIISAPSKDADHTICMGVNESTYSPSQHKIISNASCTTNCLAPVVKVLDETFGVARGTMLTVHSYTNDQQILDLPHKDLRRARAAALSQIPTTTGAAKAVGLVLPHLKGKLDGLAIRVPTPNVSMVDLTAELGKKTSREEINAAFRSASQGKLKGILGYSDAPLVSIDFNGCTNSATLDSELTTLLDGNFVKVIAWYDNETGFSARMLDLNKYLHSKE